MKPNYIAYKSIVPVLSFWRIISCIFIIPIFVLMFRIAEIKKFRIEFYDDKIITYSGLINTNKKQTVFLGVTATQIRQSVMGQIFNYGDVVVDCVGKWDIDTKNIKNPSELENYLQSKIITPNQANQFIKI